MLLKRAQPKAVRIMSIECEPTRFWYWRYVVNTLVEFLLIHYLWVSTKGVGNESVRCKPTRCSCW